MSEFDSPNYAEYAYDVKNEGKIKAARILMIIGYCVFAATSFFTLVLLSIPQVIAVLPFFWLILVLFTWRYVSFDYYFVFQGGMLELGTSRNGKGGMKKKSAVSIHVKEASFIGPYNGNADLVAGTKLYNFSESQRSDKRVLIIFEKDGKKCSAIFEGTARIAKLLASFCPNAQNMKEQVFHG